MAETVRLIHPNGCAVTVGTEKVPGLLAWGFTAPAPAAKPAARRTRKR